MDNSGQEPSYFTCTLSEAQAYNKARYHVQVESTERGSIAKNPKYANITDFIDFLATDYGALLAAGCITPVKGAKHSNDEYTTDLLTFEELRNHSQHVSIHLQEQLKQVSDSHKCVALLASSSMVFMLVWLGLIRAGYEVLLIAPQNSPEAVRHLINTSNSFAVIYDVEHEILARKALGNTPNNATGSANMHHENDHSTGITAVKLTWQSPRDIEPTTALSPDKTAQDSLKATMGSVAFYFHSSGTTGLPKLISQTHHGAVGILPMLQDNPSNLRLSTFTTTPLYHGGIADSLRSWSAASPVWLFPEGKAPIIGQSVSTCIKGIDELSRQAQSATPTRLGFLSCVPYVLETIVETPTLKERIRSLDAVGVGGAAMPKDFGDPLVADGFNLVSRFGSAECGFLLSSQRDYKSDKEWSVLRSQNLTGLEFKPLSEDKLELIVTSIWPLVSIAPHAKRPFNTHDVFVPHPRLLNAWSYAGRSDAQLTLKTGKKFDPTDIEQAIKKSEHVDEAVVIGEDKPFAAAIVFTPDMSVSVATRDEAVWNAVEIANTNNPKHAKLSRRSVCILDHTHLGRLQKNNKGGVIRSAFAADFQDEISSIYGNPADKEESEEVAVDVERIPELITTMVRDVVGSDHAVQPEDDLFEHGVDSAGSIQIRTQIVRLLPRAKRSKIPANIVYECGTIASLVKFVLDAGDLDTDSTVAKSKHDEMDQMVRSCSEGQEQSFAEALAAIKQTPDMAPSTCKGVVLTGSTGFLGVHLLHLVLRGDSVAKIYLLTRGSRLVSFEKQQQHARARVLAGLAYHQLDSHLSSLDFDGRVNLVPLFLKEPNLGIPPRLYAEIACNTTHVIHAAWEVNFNLPLKSFWPQVEGTVNLFNLARIASQQILTGSGSTASASDVPARRPVSYVFCSSIASVANATRSEPWNQQQLSTDPSHAAGLGYGQSKWVAENVLSVLSTQHPEVDVSIVRVGQLSGATQTGIWNMREAWPLMIDAALKMRDTGNDEAAKKMLLPDLASTAEAPIDWLPVDSAAEYMYHDVVNSSRSGLSVVHTPTPSRNIPWSTAQRCITEWAIEKKLAPKIVPAQEWLDALEAWSAEHQAKALLGLWRANWKPQDGDVVTDNRASGSEQDYLWRVLNWVKDGSSITSSV